jgi:hypothetical protein
MGIIGYSLNFALNFAVCLGFVIRGVTDHGLAILDLKVSLREKKNYGNSNISPCQNIIFKKSSLKTPKSFKILELYN